MWRKYLPTAAVIAANRLCVAPTLSGLYSCSPTNLRLESAAVLSTSFFVTPVTRASGPDDVPATKTKSFFRVHSLVASAASWLAECVRAPFSEEEEEVVAAAAVVVERAE